MLPFDKIVLRPGDAYAVLVMKLFENTCAEGCR